MVRGTEQRGSDGRDKKLVSRWGVAAVALLILAAAINFHLIKLVSILWQKLPRMKQWLLYAASLAHVS